jgi:hypothetical protein
LHSGGKVKLPLVSHNFLRQRSIPALALRRQSLAFDFREQVPVPTTVAIPLPFPGGRNVVYNLAVHDRVISAEETDGVRITAMATNSIFFNMAGPSFIKRKRNQLVQIWVIADSLSDPGRVAQLVNLKILFRS